MKIKSLYMKNVRSFKEKTINFTNEYGEISPVTVLIGENGSGKSTILKSIVNLLTIYNNSYQGDILNYSDLNNENKNGKTMRINANFEFNKKEKEQLYKESLKDRKDTDNQELGVGLCDVNGQYIWYLMSDESYDMNKFREFYKNFSSKEFDGGYALYFDPFRYLPNIKIEGPNTDTIPINIKEKSLSSSVVDNKVINYKYINIKQWIVNLDFKRLKSPSAENVLIYETVVNSFNKLFNPYKFLSITETGDIIFKNKDKLVSIDKLSDGFKNLFIIVGEIFYRLYSSDSNNVKFFEKEALIMIDELDCHIHPKWQINIIPFLTTIFPNCQFIVTTHSPMVIKNVPEESIIRLEDE